MASAERQPGARERNPQRGQGAGVCPEAENFSACRKSHTICIDLTNDLCRRLT